MRHLLILSLLLTAACGAETTAETAGGAGGDEGTGGVADEGGFGGDGGAGGIPDPEPVACDLVVEQDDGRIVTFYAELPHGEYVMTGCGDHYLVNGVQLPDVTPVEGCVTMPWVVDEGTPGLFCNSQVLDPVTGEVHEYGWSEVYLWDYSDGPEPVACDTDEDCEAELVCTHSGEPDAPSYCRDVGTLQACATITEDLVYVVNPETGEMLPHIYTHHEWQYIPTTPGELLTITVCEDYHLVDGVPNPDRTLEGCKTFEVVAPDDVLEQNCTQFYDASDPPPFAVGAVPYTTLEIGWKRVYVKRN